MFRLSTYPTFIVLMTAVLALVVAGALFPLWIRLLKFRNIGQQVRADGPQGHLVKQGTPTMGGVLILLVVVGIYLAMGRIGRFGIIALLAMVACGFLGFVDDYAKVLKERSLGLTPRAKLLWQTGIAVVFGVLAVNWVHLPTWVSIPLTTRGFDLGVFTTHLTLGSMVIEVPWLYLALVAFMMVSESNAVNLTDGLEVAVLAAAIAGANLGFLWYNSYPADIFMGDTGSLGLGAAIAALGAITKTELLLLLIGGIYFAEALSVILQVASFKLTGKRIFRMAPIHHHFEMKGWSETKVMVRFWIVTGILAGFGFALFFVGTVRR